MSTYLTNAFVLHNRPWREADRLYTLFTQKMGKVQVIVAGARKISSKLSPHLAPFSEVEAMVARGKQIDRLAGANLSERYITISSHMANQVLGQVCLEVIDVILPFGVAEAVAYQLLKETMVEINNLSSVADVKKWRTDAYKILSIFLRDILKNAGVGLMIDHCEHCQVPLAWPFGFSWTAHGFVHTACAKPEEVVDKLPGELANWLLKAEEQVILNETVLPVALQFLLSYLAGHVGKELKSVAVLKCVLGNQHAV